MFLFALHPFLWYYADEARPYALQMALGCALLWSSVEIIEKKGDSRAGWLGFLSSGFLLCASSLLCIIPVGSVWVALLVLFRKHRWSVRRHMIVASAVFLPLFLSLGAYYLHALNKSTEPKLWAFGANNLAYGAYEILGFQGLGPGRSALRTTASGSGQLLGIFQPHMVPIAALALAFIPVGLVGVRMLWTGRNIHVTWMTGILVLSIIGFLTLGLVLKFPFWGRHLSPLLPFFVCLVAVICRQFKSKLLGPAMILVMGLFWAVSTANIRVHPRFDKDDYRSAVLFAKRALAEGDTVWWAANALGAKFYDLQTTSFDQVAQTTDREDAGALFGPACYSVVKANANDLEALPTPSCVILSKPDIFDEHGNVRRFLKRMGYQVEARFTAFEVWARTTEARPDSQ